ncbi:MAG: hypothetical protein HOM77_03405 [Planctomycetes bacterium]|nr:hypothetical protein [Planctomycetota bacterium]MBT5100945.1 hypothetical protein [Planctomycetota bacterium]
MQMRSTTLLLLAAMAISAPSCAIPGDAAWSDLHADVYAGSILTDLSLTTPEISITDDSGAIETTGDFDINDGNATGAIIGGRLGFAPFELVVSQFDYAASHAGTLSGTVTWGGVSGSLDAPIPISSNLDLSVQKLMLGIDILNTPAFRMGLLFGVDNFDFADFSITTEGDGTVVGGPPINSGETREIVTNKSLPIPMVGVRADALLPFAGIRAGAEATGLKVAIDDSTQSIDITYLDIDANINYILWDLTVTEVELRVGYRTIMMDLEGVIESNNLNADLEFSGPYFAISAVF